MKMALRLAVKWRRRAKRIMASRPADVVIGGDNPYLNRWFFIPRNRFFNIYLHQFCRDDDDRALHDHPWPSLSLCLGGPLGEVYRRRDGTEVERWFAFGDIVYRSSRFAHRLLCPRPGAMTLFVTGPRLRAWGFHCDPPVGWRHWKEFTAPSAGYKSGAIGKGCNP